MFKIGKDLVSESHREEVQKEIKRRRFKEDIKRYTAVLSVSLLMHAMIMFFISMIPPDDPFEEQEVVIIETVFEEPEPPEEETPMVDLQVEEVIEKIEATEIELSEPESSDQELEELVEVEEEPEVNEADDTDLLEEVILLVEEDTSASEMMNMALLGIKTDVGTSGVPDAYKGRSSQKEKVKRSAMFGGGERTLDAMEKALAWLAAHQNPDGSWYFMPGHEALKPGDKVQPKAAEKEGVVVPNTHLKNINSITASAILAFLGAGYSETSGKYKRVVSNGIRFLNRSVKNLISKKKKPHFDRNYGTGMVLMALAEASIFGSSPTTKANANAIAELLLSYYKGEKGWGYNGAGEDFSVSGWIALGLKSARQAQLPAMNDKITKDFYKTYGEWVTEQTNPDSGLGHYREPKGNGSQAMGYVGMFQKQFLGFPKNDPFLMKAAEVGIKNIPQLFVAKGDLNEYNIYYGTLASFQQQGEFWKKWNAAMKKTLVTRQLPGDPEKLGGSWHPSGRHVGEHGGRVMTTALFCLCLEVYFRYSLIK